MPSSRESSQPRDEPRSLASRADSLLSEPPGKPMNTGVGSLSLFQGIFPIQELNPGLLHCRRILSQLSYLESPPQSFRACLIFSSPSTFIIISFSQITSFMSWKRSQSLSSPTLSFSESMNYTKGFTLGCR